MQVSFLCYIKSNSVSNQLEVCNGALTVARVVRMYIKNIACCAVSSSVKLREVQLGLLCMTCSLGLVAITRMMSVMLLYEKAVHFTTLVYLYIYFFFFAQILLRGRARNGNFSVDSGTLRDLRARKLAETVFPSHR